MVAHAAELTLGRTFGVAMDDGDEFFATLSSFCAENDIKYGYVPMFIGALRNAKVVGTCVNDEAEAPMFHSQVHFDYLETLGTGTIAWDAETETITPHVHLSIGERMRSARGSTSHLFEAEVQFVLEMVVVEVKAPTWTRPEFPDLHNLKMLRFGH